MTDPVATVAAQFEAYNRHDLPAFLACFADDFRSYRMPAEAPTLVGKAALAGFYAEHRFSKPALRAELLGRTVVGQRVFDHERIHGLDDTPVESMVVFDVASDGLIHTAWFYVAGQP